MPPETSAHKLVQSLAEKLESHDAVLEMGVSEIQSDVFMPVTIDRNREQEVKDEVFAELEVDGHEVEHVEPLAHEQELYTIDVADDMADVVGDTRTVQYIRSAGIKSVQDLADADPDRLTNHPVIHPKLATDLLATAQETCK